MFLKRLIFNKNQQTTKKSMTLLIMHRVNSTSTFNVIYSKTCLKQPLKSRPKIVFQTQLSLNAGQKYCRMLPLLQEEHSEYFRPSLSYHLSLRSLFCLFLIGRLRQVLLYLELYF